jgi:imidazolonepropionase-like amidohydrolase
MTSERERLTRLFSLVFLLLLGSCTDLFAQTSAPRSAEVVLIKAGRLIDVKTGSLLSDQAILIEGERIKDVGAWAQVSGRAPAGAKLIDLSGAVVMPGFIDCHTHITSQSGNYYERLFRQSPIDTAVVAHIYARRTVEAGFTTVRDVGSGEFIDVALRNAINKGDIVGPRMQVATLGIGATGGHADLTGFSPYLKFGQFSGIADGIDEIRKQVRFEVKNGADLIKMIATAGVLSEEESVGAPQYSQAEMNAVVEEAAMWGKKVAAHAHGAEGIKRAVRAGVASIEHGSLLDEEAIKLMKERGTYLVADIYNDDYILAEFTRLGYPEKVIEKERSIGRLQRESFQRAVRAGVKIAFGSDAGVYPHGWNGKQFAHMVRWGLTPMQAIQAATVNAADLLGWSEQVGSIEAGRYADIIAVSGDPIKDITVLERIEFVLKGGQLIKNAISPAASVAR